MRIILLSLTLILALFQTAHAEKSIGIYTYLVSDMKPWDPDDVKTGICGSEEAIIYLSQKLAELGYKVLVFATPPQNSQHSLPEANPRYVNIDFNDYPTLDVAISWRMPNAAQKLKLRARKVYLWPHDTISHTVSNEEINNFDDVLWLSEWQRKQWISVNPGFAKFTKIFGNGIEPKQFKENKQKANPHACIYGSNYARGLEVLLDIWPVVRQKFPDATLDIYYGWQDWGLLSLEKKVRMKAQVMNYACLGVTEHGQVGHEELNRAYENASLWTYPCIGLETFCISALRAQLSGAIPVIIDGSALDETVKHGYKCTKKEEYLPLLLNAMLDAEKIPLDERKKMGEFVLEKFTWEKLARQLDSRLHDQKE
ncbi:glycosyltransferase family 4 protein [Parachlamydia sp.]|jgi:glycosyltransferase involved in cell wall biosynthesis|uniref:glycosyltransferase family 4 protein n=1 Tax=Parachlamydia sp. TaxID=2052048 RepID=UPI003D0FD215